MAGVAALLWARFPDATLREVRDRLLNGTIPTASLLTRTRTGGRVNAFRAMSKQDSGPPILLAQPESLAVPLGATAAFGVAVDGTAPLSYQWYRDGEPLPGATRPILAFDEVADTQAGAYEVVITNPEGSVRSEAANLTLLPPLPISTFAGALAFPGHADGRGRMARFNNPLGLAADAAGNLYVADHGNSAVRLIAPNSVVSTLAGKAGETGSTDGPGPNARFKFPRAVAVHPDGTVFVADSDNHTIRRITATGVVSTFAGLAGETGNGDGPGHLARFNLPTALAVDRDGNVFVADTLNHTIRKITPGGSVSTLAGRAGSAGATDGVGDAARFSTPQGITVDGNGNHAIRRIDLPSREPEILVPPSDLVTVAGEATAFRVIASGSAPLAYEWFKDGQSVPGFLGPTLSLLNPTPAHAGEYQVRVSNALGAVTSVVARLVVLPYHPPQLVGVSPADGAEDVAPNTAIRFQIQDRDTGVNAPTIRLWLDEREITGEIQLAAGPGGATVQYQPALLRGSSTYSVRVSFEDRASPPLTITRQWRFTTVRMPVVPPEFRTALGTGVESGFNVRSVQAAPGLGRANSVAEAELQLGNPPRPPVYFSGVATPALINYSETGAPRGNFTAARGRPDESLRQAELVSPDHSNFASFEITTYLELEAGVHRFGVNSDDGFRLAVGPTTSTNDSVVLGEWDGGRTSTDSQIEAFVPESGLYAFRLIWFQGVGNADLEWFTVDRATGVRTLVNDVADTLNHTVRKITPDAAVTTLAGNPGGVGGVDGTGANARFNEPTDVAVAVDGTVYVADKGNHTIRRITPDGSVTTVAGLAGVTGSNNGPGATARFFSPTGVALDQAGNLYVTESVNSRVRKITPPGLVSTFSGAGMGSQDGAWNVAKFNQPDGIVFAPDGFLYVVDFGGDQIRKVAADGSVTTFAGSTRGYADGLGRAAQFRFPQGLAVDAMGTLYLADTANFAIRTITPEGLVGTLAGGTIGFLDGLGTAARFRSPTAIAVDPAGNVLVADSGNHLIRKLRPNGLVTTLAGLAEIKGSTDGPERLARFNNPKGIAVSKAGLLYVADTGNSTIRRGIPNYIPPLITRQPQSLATTGTGVSFEVAALSAHPVSFLWRKNGALIPGETNATLRIESVTGTEAGIYSAVAVNAYGSAASSDAQLTFLTPPEITRQPDSLTVLAGAEATFEVEATGSVPLAHQWRHGGTNLPGALEPSLTLPQITPLHAGDYSVIVTNDLGAVTSQVAVLTVHVPPFIVEISPHQLLAVGSNVTLNVVADGTGPFTFQWFRGESPLAEAVEPALVLRDVAPADSAEYVVEVSSPFGEIRGVVRLTVLAPPAITTPPVSIAVIERTDAVFRVEATGGEPLSYQWLHEGIPLPDATQPTLTVPAVGAIQAGNYTVVVHNPVGSAESPPAMLVVNIPPRITTQPQSASIPEGQRATLAVIADGTPPLSYQWRHRDRELADQTAATLVLEAISRDDAGPYSVTVRNAHGSVSSDVATLRVRVPQRLELPEPLPDGGFRLRFRDHDGGLAEDLSVYVLESSDHLPSTDLNAWQATALVPSSDRGFGVFNVTAPPGSSGRFYRIVER